jgi:hypothetical protein
MSLFLPCFRNGKISAVLLTGISLTLKYYIMGRPIGVYFERCHVKLLGMCVCYHIVLYRGYA